MNRLAAKSMENSNGRWYGILAFVIQDVDPPQCRIAKRCLWCFKLQERWLKSFPSRNKENRIRSISELVLKGQMPSMVRVVSTPTKGWAEKKRKDKFKPAFVALRPKKREWRNCCEKPQQRIIIGRKEWENQNKTYEIHNDLGGSASSLHLQAKTKKNFHYYWRKLQTKALKSQSPNYTQKNSLFWSKSLPNYIGRFHIGN